jgi:hypothetical protein
MAHRGRNLVAINQDYVVDAAELNISTSETRPLSSLKCEIMPHNAEAALQWLIIQVSFI